MNARIDYESISKIANMNKLLLEKFSIQDHPKKFTNGTISKKYCGIRENNKLFYAYDIK